MIKNGPALTGEGNTDKEIDMLANRSPAVKVLWIVLALIGVIGVLAFFGMAAMCGGMMGMM